MPFHHLRQFDQDYWSHFKDAIRYSGKAFLASGYFLGHALIPDLFTKLGSSTVEKLHTDILTKQRQHAEINGTRENIFENI
jgi:hypothetical protein